MSPRGAKRRRKGPRGELANALRALRVARGWTQEKAAKALRVSRSWVAVVETGAWRPQGLARDGILARLRRLRGA
jgi:transcriptional regulator with XRE-family HTH domain